MDLEDTANSISEQMKFDIDKKLKSEYFRNLVNIYYEYKIIL